MSRKDKKEQEPGRYAYEGLDRIVHEKARLGILTSLSTHREGLLFNQLKNLCSLSDGNLSRHIQTLQQAGLVEVWKGFHRRRPQTLCRITPAGLDRFQAYLHELEKVIRDAARASEKAPCATTTTAQRWVPA